LVNGSWIEILEKVIGRCELQPEDLAKSFYYRTYFNVTNLARVFAEFGVPFESIEEMMLDENKIKHTFKPGIETIKHTFRLVKFIFGILKFENHFLKEFPLLEKRTKELEFKIENTKTIVEQFDILYNDLFTNTQALTHLNIITPLLMRAYSKRLGKMLNKLGVNSEEIDFNIDFPELKMLSPVSQMAEIREQIDKLPADAGRKANTYKEFSQLPEAQTIVKLLQEFIEKFGHHSESGNDISHKKWEEDPEFVFKMVIDSIDIKNKSEQLHFQELKIPFFKKRKYYKSYQKAGRFSLYREKISSLYIFGYGLFRKLYLKVADDFVKKGILNEKEDIFYLDKKEVQKIIVEKNVHKINWGKIIATRKAEYEATKDLILPSVIYGEEAPLIEHGSIKNFNGVGTSSGTFKGKTKVINHISDFNKVEEGDVVIIPFSDVSWTPVLVKAGAIVSESGGMLSHCSIIAREMGIPALVSVDNACSLNDNLLVTVNGSNGILTIHDYE
jgi:pyruvate,water dikinase